MTARPAATLCVLRPEDTGFSVLMVHRGAAPFAPRMYVFPGGKVDDGDRGDAARTVMTGARSPELVPWMGAALRETFEEAGVLARSPAPSDEIIAALRGLSPGEFWEALAARAEAIDVSGVGYLSNWVTPDISPLRFDTRFFVTIVPAGTTATPDAEEVLDAVWVSPPEALRRQREGSWPMIFPTVKHLELLAGWDDPNSIVRSHQLSEVSPVHPRPIRVDGEWRFLLPGDAGYGEER
jgi:8-oxo-dGTP pyrophosphatase MutT (NUDIX family)